MAGVDNLIPVTKRTKEEARELSIRGGKASGERRRHLKTMREWAAYLGKMDADFETTDGQKVKGNQFGAMVVGQIRKANQGNTKAAKFVAELLGEGVKNISIKGDGMRIVVESKEQKEMLDKLGDLGV